IPPRRPPVLPAPKYSNLGTASLYALPHQSIPIIFHTSQPLNLPPLHVHHSSMHSIYIYSPDSLYPHKSAFVANAGINISCLSWSVTPSTLPASQTLAIAGAPPLSGTNIYSQSSCKNHIQLWQLRDESKTISCSIKSFLLHSWGNVLDLQFSPIYPHLLGGIFQDGSFRLLKIPENWEKYVLVQTPALTINLSKTAITCFCWYDSMSICVGCANGFIAKYNIFPNHPNQHHPNQIPTQIHKVHDSYIDKIVTSLNGLVITHSYDCYTKITDLNSVTIRTSTRSRCTHLYLPAHR
ncbi:Transcription factor tau subunit sfc6, partial [Neolecta irregularis DAH-3]